MAEIRARGIIIKQSDYGEGHRMLTVFTEEYGIVKAVSYGVKKSKSKAAASSQFLCYGDFDFYKGVGKDIMTINNIDTHALSCGEYPPILIILSSYTALTLSIGSSRYASAYTLFKNKCNILESGLFIPRIQ